MNAPGWARLVRAGNAGPMTLDGTNTWVLGEPGELVVVDPGPDDEAHLQAVAALGRVALVLLTHGHVDHAAGAARLAATTGADVLSRQDGGLAPDGQTVQAGGVALQVLDTPGHSSDSVCFVADGAVLTGDTVLGRGTTVVAHPDGRLADYLTSLRRLQALGARIVLPGHGPVLDDCAQVATAYLAHRAERLAQVRRAVQDGVREPRAVVERVYADVDRAVWPAAELSVRAQLDYLREHG